MKWKKHFLHLLLTITNEERENFNLPPLDKKGLKIEYNVTKWTEETIFQAAYGENSVLGQRKQRRIYFDEKAISAHPNTSNEFRSFLSDYRFNYSYNRLLVIPILNFCIIEGIMNKILNYYPTDNSYISFNKRWKRFENYIINSLSISIPRNKMTRLYKNVRNRLLHGEYASLSLEDRLFLNELMFNMLKLDIQNQRPDLLNGITPTVVSELPIRHNTIDNLYRVA